VGFIGADATEINFGSGRAKRWNEICSKEDELMVDDIHFPKGLPAVSASGKIQRVNRKKRDDEKPPFEKYLDAEDEKDKKKRKRKKKSDTVDVTGKAQKGLAPSAIESSNSNDTAEAEDDSEQKIIDVRV
jgi:hypothetical protein